MSEKYDILHSTGNIPSNLLFQRNATHGCREREDRTLFRNYCTPKLQLTLLHTHLRRFTMRDQVQGQLIAQGYLLRTYLSMDIDCCKIKPGTLRVQDTVCPQAGVRLATKVRRNSKHFMKMYRVNGMKMLDALCCLDGIETRIMLAALLPMQGQWIKSLLPYQSTEIYNV